LLRDNAFVDEQLGEGDIDRPTAVAMNIPVK
jgi:hypothetical protein